MSIVTPLTNMNTDPSYLVQNSSTANLLSSIISSVQILSNNVSLNTSSTVVGTAVSGGSGALVLKTKSAKVVCSGNSPEIIPLQIPEGALIVAVQVRNDTNIVLSGSDAVNSVYFTGTSGVFNQYLALYKNAKVNAICDPSTGSFQTTSISDLGISPFVDTIVSGTITAVAYYYELTPLSNI